MTRFNIYLIVGLLVGALLASLMAEDAGYVLLRWRGWQLETSIWVAVGLGALLALSLVLLRGLFRSTFRMPKKLRQWFGLRSARGAQRLADKGITAFFEGRWDVAERALRKVNPSEARTVLHPLYAAVAACRKGDYEQANNVLNQAERAGETPRHLVLITRAECQLATQDYDQARQTLSALTGTEQALPRTKKLLAQVAYAQKAWVELITLVSDLRHCHQLPEMVLDMWEREAYSALMADGSQSSPEFLALWRRVPAALKEEGSVVWAALVRSLVFRCEWELLLKVLTERLSEHFEVVSLDAVRAFPERRAAKLAKVLRRWVDKDVDGRCHAALAHIAGQEDRTGEAGELWQQAYSLGKRPDIAAQWAHWLRQQGDEAKAAQIQREAFQLLAVPE